MRVLKIVFYWVVGIIAFCYLMAWAGRETEQNCQEKGRQLNAPAELVGRVCVVKGWGRVF